ncbi:TetR family transcriptional regulator [Nocardiopsis alba]|uniref:TetR family transcriptional regulator n=1 Tax=Nocardiopsis alba TaxID=53437 RepID=A0A7K2IPN5_9ACTN|nr:TetR family transcriptional regulator [Nocardiopsis alba]
MEHEFNREGSPDGDLTTKARVRDAAITCFGAKGFGVTVRAVAERAQVSPGLVIHHFGSKAGLREACDEHVRRTIYRIKEESILHPSAQGLIGSIREAGEYTDLLAYLLRSVQEGGELGRHLYDAMVEDMERYLERGVEEGTVRASRAPAKRARWLAANGFGSLLVLLTTSGNGESPDFDAVLREWEQEYILPALEVYTEGLLIDRTMLDAYLLYIGDPPEGES